MKSLICTIAFLAVFTASAELLPDAQAKYLATKKRVIARQIVGDKIVYTYRQGKRTWTTTNTIKRIDGKLSPVRYSKLKLIVAAKAAGKWDAVKEAIKRLNLEDEWQACQFVAADYPAYISATNAVVQQGIATDAEVKAFMSQAEDAQ